MIMGIMQQIKATVTEAIDLAKSMQETTSESFLVIASIPKSLNKSTVVIVNTKRPFPVGKFADLHRRIGGSWKYKRTAFKFVKIAQLRHSSTVRLIINLYMKECLNPLAHGTIAIAKGHPSRVLEPDKCNGLETPLMLGFGIEDGTRKEA